MNEPAENIKPTSRNRNVYFQRFKTLEEKFFEKVRKSDGCWEWIGMKLKSGYGRMKVGDKTERAHRVSYEIHIGPIPDGMLVCHKCDNRPCVNPDHLFLGSSQDNRADCVKKGRQANGERQHIHKLDERDIPNIMALAEAIPHWQIAEKYAVHRATISRVVRGDTWFHISSPNSAL